MSTSARYLKLRKIAYEFAFCVDPVDFPSYWERHADVLHGCRMVFSDARLPSLLPDGLDTRTFGIEPKAYLYNFFVSSGLFFFSPESLRYRNQVAGIFPLRIDYSVALDSNVVGDIHKFMTGKCLDSRGPAFLDMATYLRRHRINLDAMPYLLENFEKARANRKHLDFVINGFSTFYRFTTSSLLRENPATPGDFYFEMSEQEAKCYAEKTVVEMLNDPRFQEDGTRRL